MEISLKKVGHFSKTKWKNLQKTWVIAAVTQVFQPAKIGALA